VDTKDWTWVLERPCGECGYDARGVQPAEVEDRISANAGAWRSVLAGERVGVRPEPEVWSPLEYACHVRDVHRVFADRVRLMLAEDDPLFADWDQDEAADRGRYGDQDAATVAVELVDAAAVAAGLYGSVSGARWDRPGRRSNGSVFTTLSLARYHLHDVEHHLFDVSG
jgi:hypothetical protein